MKKLLIILILVSATILSGCSPILCKTENEEISKLNLEIGTLNSHIAALNAELEQSKTETDKQTKLDECLAKAETKCEELKTEHSNKASTCVGDFTPCTAELGRIWADYKSKCLSNALRDECITRY